MSSGEVGTFVCGACLEMKRRSSSMCLVSSIGQRCTSTWMEVRSNLIRAIDDEPAIVADEDFNFLVPFEEEKKWFSEVCNLALLLGEERNG
jgi:hypothetical protein